MADRCTTDITEKKKQLSLQRTQKRVHQEGDIGTGSYSQNWQDLGDRAKVDQA